MTNKHPSLFSPFMLTEKIKLRNRIVTVSYTHLTLPTTERV